MTFDVALLYSVYGGGPSPPASGEVQRRCNGKKTMRLFEGTPFDRPPRCERCGELEEVCTCPPAPPTPPPRIPPEKQTARLAIEKRKKGKTVTVVRGLPADGNDLASLLTQLKNACGAGGTLKDDAIEIQGKHLERVRQTLSQIGYGVKG